MLKLLMKRRKINFFVATCFSSNVSSESWLIDTGCTNHMTHDKELFMELKPSKILDVKIGHGSYILVKGIGTIAIATHSGTKTIFDLLYVPDLDQNLLSVSQLLEKGLKVFFKDNYYLIKDAIGQDLFKVKMRGKSFSLDSTQEEQIAFLAKENVAELWHKRLGYHHYQWLLKMQKFEMAIDLPDFEVIFKDCCACQYGK